MCVYEKIHSWAQAVREPREELGGGSERPQTTRTLTASGVSLAPAWPGLCLAAARRFTEIVLLLCLVFTAGLMVKKSASDVSISGTDGQYSILQTAKLLPGAPQQAVSSPVFSSK